MSDDKYGPGRTLDAMNARGLAGKRDYVRSLEQRRELLVFPAVKQRLLPGEILFVKPLEKKYPGPGKNLHIRERILLAVLPRAGDDKCPDFSEPADLAVDMAHLTFQERGAIAGDDRAAHGPTKKTDAARRGERNFASLSRASVVISVSFPRR